MKLTTYSLERGCYVSGDDAEIYSSMQTIGNYRLKPDVSVIIPTYNRPDELRNAIISVEAQRFNGNFEIVIVDDSKNDIPINELEEFKKPKILIKYIKNFQKIGGPLSRNVGIYNSNGTFVEFLDDDDTWMTDKTDKQIEVFNENKDVSLSVCYSEDHRFGSTRICKPKLKSDKKTLLKSFNLSSTSSYMTKKAYLDLVRDEFGHYFDPTFESAQEYDLAIRLMDIGYSITVPEVLMVQNSPKNGQISQDWNRKINGMKRLREKYRDDYSRSCKIKNVGVTTLFRVAKIPGVGNRIYKVIIPIKKIYER